MRTAGFCAALTSLLLLAACSSQAPAPSPAAPAQPEQPAAQATETPAASTETPAAAPETPAETPPAAGKEAPAPEAKVAPPPEEKWQKTLSGLEYADLRVGTGTEAVPGHTVSVHYTGWLLDGTKFDSSVDRGQPFQFPLGAGRVIRGWDEGVAGMKVGGIRKLRIPPNLGYGDQGAGAVIPPGATLLFQVELLGVQ